MPSTALVSHSQDEHCCGNTKLDVAIRSPSLLRIDPSNSLSGSELSFQRYTTSFDIAAQGLGA